jgi:hypothetical protein
MKILTVLKTGGDFTAEYVHKIREGLTKHMQGPYEFYCLNDDPELENVMGTIHLKHNWPGWWSKMEMYRFDPPFLYIDLDCVINGPLEPMVEPAKDKGFVCIKPIFRPTGIASGMLWVGKDMKKVYEDFAREPAQWRTRATVNADPAWNHGDQRVLELMGIEPDAYWQDLTPLFQHRKDSTEEQRRAASLIMYSGNPRPHETGWSL